MDTILGLNKNLKNKYNLQIQYLYCNNASENVAFEKACKQAELAVEFEYTAPGTPQQNENVECQFAILFNSVCVMLNGSKFKTYPQNGL